MLVVDKAICLSWLLYMPVFDIAHNIMTRLGYRSDVSICYYSV